MFLKQSTPFTFRLGPFLDDLDGNTEENALSITYTDIYLSKAGASFVQKNDTTGGGTGSRGHYECTLDTEDTSTCGTLRVWCHVAGALPVFKDFTVLSANVYDAIVSGTDYLDIEAYNVEGSYSLRDMLKLMASVLCGKASGGGTTEIRYFDLITGTTERVKATCDANGNRSSVTLDTT